ncbi:hypothetical protein PIB30_060391 [Stylosanthes scabra]|uniref:Uncharacterized protein n=1 Tax=Stylosanthes scabra TaxID=79078 RepID=A0ABU6WNA4_9FABA|nr:hypothetical protein [Stylosanthes scabra]
MNTPSLSNNPKIAFMFLTPGSLPFERLWDKFSQVQWGNISMADAERRLLANALLDPDNQHFVLLSDSFEDIGPQGNGRYSHHMLPEIQMKDFRKGGQWFTLKRQHALIVMADNLYYSKFRAYCKLGFEGKYCITDEHYLPTLFNIVDPAGISNWSVTYVDWSQRGWHPRSYGLQDVTYQLFNNITSIDVSMHVTSNEKVQGPPFRYDLPSRDISIQYFANDDLLYYIAQSRQQRRTAASCWFRDQHLSRIERRKTSHTHQSKREEGNILNAAQCGFVLAFDLPALSVNVFNVCLGQRFGLCQGFRNFDQDSEIVC